MCSLMTLQTSLSPLGWISMMISWVDSKVAVVSGRLRIQSFWSFQSDWRGESHLAATNKSTSLESRSRFELSPGGLTGSLPPVSHLDLSNWKKKEVRVGDVTVKGKAKDKSLTTFSSTGSLVLVIVFTTIGFLPLSFVTGTCSSSSLSIVVCCNLCACGGHQRPDNLWVSAMNMIRPRSRRPLRILFLASKSKELKIDNFVLMLYLWDKRVTQGNL